jgi:pyruvate/2-oxoglutarate dehydrogenase complex dihydrolipoamide acyltransferase (E2) component
MSRRTAKAAVKAVPDSGRSRVWGIAAAVAAVVLGGGWYLLQPSRAARIATRTIVMQKELLAKATDPAPKRKTIEEITSNVDTLPPDEIRRVRDDLFRQLKAMREESLARFARATPDERLALLDDDLDRIRLARRLLDATDQGGMRPVTEAELREREERRKQRDEQAKQAATAQPAPTKQPGAAKQPGPSKQAAAARPNPPRPQSEQQKLATDYFEALTKRAKEKNVDLGRMFGRPPGRG